MEINGQLSKQEADLLASIGYVVVRWNYAESFARQLIGMYVQGDSLFHPERLKLAKLPSLRIEEELQAKALPRWLGEGRPYLERLIECYTRAREHRNHLVHGIYMTFGPMGPNEAQALLVPAMPKDGKPQAPTYAAHSEIRSVASHFHDLATFARDVSLAFDEEGSRAVDREGKPVLGELPSMLAPIHPCKFETIDPALFNVPNSAA
jgi:hypothetical protein